MKRLFAWIAVNAIWASVVFSGVFEFPHFWQEWEFMAATSAFLYSVVFVLFSLTNKTTPSAPALSKTLVQGEAMIPYLVFRVSSPAILFVVVFVLLLVNRAHAHETLLELLKLGSTLLAFITIWFGDLYTAQILREKNKRETESPWIAHFQQHAWLVDFPLVVGYAGLFVAFVLYQIQPPKEPLVQPFLGGASAFEMLVLSAIHGLSDLADRRREPPFPQRT
jgi:hypothetical protein